MLAGATKVSIVRDTFSIHWKIQITPHSMLATNKDTLLWSVRSALTARAADPSIRARFGGDVSAFCWGYGLRGD